MEDRITLEFEDLPWVIVLGKKKPKRYAINGNRIYDGSIHRFTRAKIMDMLHEYFIEKIEEFKKQNRFTDFFANANYPIAINLVIQKPKPLWDADNQWIWAKVFMDSLKIAELIPDDNVEYINFVSFLGSICKKGEAKLIVHICNYT